MNPRPKQPPARPGRANASTSASPPHKSAAAAVNSSVLAVTQEQMDEGLQKGVERRAEELVQNMQQRKPAAGIFPGATPAVPGLRMTHAQMAAAFQKHAPGNSSANNQPVARAQAADIGQRVEASRIPNAERGNQLEELAKMSAVPLPNAAADCLEHVKALRQKHNAIFFADNPTAKSNSEQQEALLAVLSEKDLINAVNAKQSEHRKR